MLSKGVIKEWEKEKNPKATYLDHGCEGSDASLRRSCAMEMHLCEWPKANQFPISFLANTPWLTQSGTLQMIAGERDGGCVG